MARTENQIFSQIVNAYVIAMAAIGITINPATWSRRNKQQLAMRTFANSTATFEQVYDAYTSDIELAIASAAPQTPQWIQAQMLQFQFDPANPQIPQIGANSVIAYPKVIAADQVIKFCSVRPGPLGTTLVKVAANNNGLPADLDTTVGTGALHAANSYVKILTDGSIAVNVVSGNADILYCFATIWYQGAYSAIIQANVIAAITAYLNGIPFNGFVTLSDLEAAIKAVPGINDIVFTNVQAGVSGTAYGSGYVLVVGVDGVAPTGNIVQRNYSTQAGYITSPTSGGQQLANTLTFIAQ